MTSLSLLAGMTLALKMLFRWGSFYFLFIVCFAPSLGGSVLGPSFATWFFMPFSRLAIVLLRKRDMMLHFNCVMFLLLMVI